MSAEQRSHDAYKNFQEAEEAYKNDRSNLELRKAVVDAQSEFKDAFRRELQDR